MTLNAFTDTDARRVSQARRPASEVKVVVLSLWPTALTPISSRLPRSKVKLGDWLRKYSLHSNFGPFFLFFLCFLPIFSIIFLFLRLFGAFGFGVISSVSSRDGNTHGRLGVSLSELTGSGAHGMGLIVIGFYHYYLPLGDGVYKVWMGWNHLYLTQNVLPSMINCISIDYKFFGISDTE